MSALTGACADLTAWLPVAAALLTEPDADGTTTRRPPRSRHGVHAQTGSAPPWNAAAAAAYFDAAEGVRQIETALRTEVAGQPGNRRGGSGGNTMAALTAISSLGAAVHPAISAAAARQLNQWVTAIRQLPAVDEAERWQRIPAACPYCGMAMLQVAPKAGRVTCLRFGACFDADGRHPVGQMEVGQLGGAQVRWADGLVAP